MLMSSLPAPLASQPVVRLRFQDLPDAIPGVHEPQKLAEALEKRPVSSGFHEKPCFHGILAPAALTIIKS